MLGGGFTGRLNLAQNHDSGGRMNDQLHSFNWGWALAITRDYVSPSRKSRSVRRLPSACFGTRGPIELRFRDIKTTMGMEMLRTKSAQMALKEVMMHMIAYNAVRLLMLKAAAAYHCNHRRIGFKAVLQVLEACRSAFEKVAGKPQLLSREKDNLLERIAERAEAERPGRNEPRKKKRRPKSYGWLQRPRHSYFEHFRNENPPFKILDNAA